MYYQIHIMKNGEDGMFHHIPLYFLTTKELSVAEENFEKVVNNFFEFEDYPKIERFKTPNSFGDIMRATGEITAKWNLCGTYIISLTTNPENIQTQPII